MPIQHPRVRFVPFNYIEVYFSLFFNDLLKCGVMWNRLKIRFRVWSKTGWESDEQPHPNFQLVFPYWAGGGAVNFRFWSYLGWSGENPTICSSHVAMMVSFTVSTRRNIKRYLTCLKYGLCWGSKNPRPRQGFNVKSLTNIPTISYAKYPPPDSPPGRRVHIYFSPPLLF